MQQKPGETLFNFGRNVEFKPQVSFQPTSVEEVLEILRNHKGERIRVSGRLHSWSDVVVAEEVHLDLKHLSSVEIKKQNGASFATVGSGCQIKNLLKELKAQGLTLPSVGLIDEQTVAGATATGTHGSGKNSLSHYIEAVEIAHYDPATGEPVITTISSGLELKAARCSLGLLGVIVAIKFKCRRSYRIKEHIEKYASLKKVLDAEKRYPLQQFYLMPWSWNYYGHHRVESNEPKSKSAFWYRAYWSAIIDVGLHVVVYVLVKLLRFKSVMRFFYKRILPMTMARNWKVVDDSHKMLVMEHELFRHIEIEFFVIRAKLPDAIEYVIDTISVFGGQPTQSGNTQRRNEPEQFAGSYFHHYPICVRRVLADDTLISMSSPIKSDGKEDWYAISLISYDWPSRREGFFKFANHLAAEMATRFGARAHWGKYNPLTAEQNARLYPNLEEFNSIRAKFDSDGRFENDWLSKVMRE